MRDTNVYIADFETTTEAFYNEYGFTRVWASCVVDMNTLEVVHIGNDINCFIEWCKSNPDSKVFFHNLKFDGEFILHYILSNGYVYEKDLVSDKSYNSIIDNFGQWYMLKVNFEGSVVTFYDSFKKLPFKVKDLGEMLKLEEQKLIIDYDAFRPEGYILTDEEVEYIQHDCIIVAKALKGLFERGLNALTLSGDAQKYYKGLFKSAREYDYCFPAVTLDVDEEIRYSYKGGFVYCNEQFAGQIVEGCSFDVNSLYPYVLHECMLPCGQPIKYEGEYIEDKRFPVYIAHIMVDFTVKEGYLPTIQIKHSRFNETEYLKSSDGVVSLYLTKPDLELFIEHYDIHFIKYIDGYKFCARSDLFKKYVDYWYQEKKEAKEKGEHTRLMIAKLMLNSLYGRYGMGTCRINKLAYLDEQDVTKFNLSSPEYVAPQYTALASFVTAYARCITIRASQLCYDKGIYLYSDTDSVHIKGYEAPEGMEVDSYKLGAWKNEGNFKGKFLRAKTYIKFKESKGKPYIDITCAGMPANIKDEIKALPNPFEVFKVGFCTLGKLVPKRVKGGVILVNRTYTLKPN